MEEKYYQGIKVEVCEPGVAKGVMQPGYSCAGQGSRNSLVRAVARETDKRHYIEEKREEEAKTKIKPQAPTLTDKQKSLLRKLGAQAPSNMKKKTATRKITTLLRKRKLDVPKKP